MSEQSRESRTRDQRSAELQEAFLEEYSKTLPEEYYAPTMVLSQAILRSMAQYERFAKRQGLTYNALLVLLCLHFASDAVSQHVVSKALWLPKQTVGSVINGFRKKGLIKESPDPRDARAKAISLTKEGQEFADSVFQRLQDLDRQALEAVSKDGLEVAVQSMNAYTEAFERALAAQSTPGGTP